MEITSVTLSPKEKDKGSSDAAGSIHDGTPGSSIVSPRGNSQGSREPFRIPTHSRKPHRLRREHLSRTVSADEREKGSSNAAGSIHEPKPGSRGVCLRGNNTEGFRESSMIPTHTPVNLIDRGGVLYLIPYYQRRDTKDPAMLLDPYMSQRQG